ncbi:2'-5' RNA ligase family protein [bacterium]|nr:2'-5' RNA ligase family protein [bacterium]
MKKEKFLTVYAVLDDATQEVLSALQKQILMEFPNGTQTMDIPFHISLGSFPVKDKNELICRIANVLDKVSAFDITIDGMGHFNYTVVFAEPMINQDLIQLHELFVGNYADGFDWHPHITLYCGEQEEGEYILKNYTVPKIQAKIVGIQLGEFFPTNMIMKCKF